MSEQDKDNTRHYGCCPMSGSFALTFMHAHEKNKIISPILGRRIFPVQPKEDSLF